MNKRIIIKLDHETKTPVIECDNIIFDAAKIKGMEISEWAIPFLIEGKRWNGLYEELKEFYGCDEYTAIFHGTDNELAELKQVFSNKPVKIVGQNNKVIILYDRDKLTTKITVNGKIFDTSRINNKAVSEWVLPFSNDVTEWKGIFAEIDNFLGTNSYSIQFMGNTDDMRILMDNSPGGINITYRTPAALKKALHHPFQNQPIQYLSFKLLKIHRNLSNQSPVILV